MSVDFLPAKLHIDDQSSGLQLERISPTTIRPLKHLTKTPEIDHHPPSQEAYSPLTPTLHLYLSRNMLRAIPGELFNLKYLTVLSLRNNKLTELPSAIANLENLVELNVGGNRLKWLPWEILKLVAGQLRILNVYPNPLFEPPRSRNGAEGVEAKDKVKKAFELLHRGPTPQASTAVTFMNFDGSICRGMPTAPSSAMYAASLVISSLPNYWPADLDWPSTSQVPSLLELALGECSQSPYLSQLPELLPEDSPTSIARLLKEAHATKEAGGRICSVCGKSYLIARTEWLEWWNCVVELEMVRTVSYCNTLPLLRRGCSWRCVPTDLDPDRL